jgi:predicted GNAT family acetyltransferase
LADPAATPIIRDNVEARRFEMSEGNEVAALYYERTGNIITFVHTEVPEAIGGRGHAMRLAKHGLDTARAQNLKVIPICPVVRSFLNRHPEYRDLVIAWPKDV